VYLPPILLIGLLGVFFVLILPKQIYYYEYSPYDA